jgi:hypothetical protein
MTRSWTTSITPDADGQPRTAFGAVCSHCLHVIARDPAIVTPAGSIFHPHCAVAMSAYFRHAQRLHLGRSDLGALVAGRCRALAHADTDRIDDPHACA